MRATAAGPTVALGQTVLDCTDARLLLDRADDVEEPLRVYADPAGHPFCIFVTAPPPAV